MHSSCLTTVRLKFLCSLYQSALPLELFIGPNAPDLVAVSIAHDDTIGDLRERLGNEILLRIDWDLWADRGDSTNARVNAVLDLLETPIASVFPGDFSDIADPSAPPPPVEPYLESAPDGSGVFHVADNISGDTLAGPFATNQQAKQALDALLVIHPSPEWFKRWYGLELEYAGQDVIRV
ncbi:MULTISPECIES: hypothetical protein [Asaia]|uniref:Uncharacterized protein n=1 Tax=Asaia bogorensis TaxID=91915 RepID=A0A060QDB8_9PROT|nr:MULTISPECIES: hypothetical protein [Asaia]ETC99496.1 hypothetical protein P792_03415 [Asaia sp. SF2.1]CDG38930.1 hypothetical protein ASAP_0885 [Asaia bogorensis]